MPTDASFQNFENELNRLVASFGCRLAELKGSDYNEAKLRDDFLNPFFRALGWDMENRAGLIQKEREVEIESATHIGGGRKRADYLFRADKRDRFVCEAKKPAEDLHARYAFQAKRYAWNKGVFVALRTDFEELKIYLVGGKPHLDEPHVGEWKHWNFRQYPLLAREIWDLLARENVAGGSIDRAIDALPRKATGTGKDLDYASQWFGLRSEICSGCRFFNLYGNAYSFDNQCFCDARSCRLSLLYRSSAFSLCQWCSE